MSLAERLNELEPREKRLLFVFGAALGALMLVGLPAYAIGTVSSARDENAALRSAIDEIGQSRAVLEKRAGQKKELSTRYAQPAPPLAAFLAKNAAEHKVEIPESQDRPNVPHGKRFEERSTKLTLRKVGMLALLQFMESIAKAPYPLSLSRLDIRKRGAEPDSYDVELVVSAFDRKAPEPGKAAGAGAEEASP